MAYSTLPAKVAADTVSLTNWDNIRDNFIASAPDAFTTKGDLFAATGADAGARVAVGANDSILVADSAQTAGLAWQIVPAARVYNSGALALSAGVWTTLTFNSERYDTDAVHSTVTNTGRLTVPSGGDGLYLIGGCVEFDTTSLGSGVRVGVRILLGGTTTIARQVVYGIHSDEDTALAINCMYLLSATNYVELQAYSSAGLNVNVTANFSPEFWLQWMRRQ
mgnify:CR=1 FL=1